MHPKALVVGVLLVALAALAGGTWAVLGAPGGGRGARTTPTGEPTVPVTAPAGADSGTVAGMAVPRKVVDPLRGATYCATVRLLAVYAHQTYALDARQGVVTGMTFVARLHVVAATYRRLADQAGAQPRTGAAAASWSALATAATATERRLRKAGPELRSRRAVAGIAALARAARKQLPTATGTLPDACGLAPDVLGL
jgi:hypothetical protein